MASIHGYIEDRDLKQFYDIRDWRGSVPKATQRPWTLFSLLKSNKDFFYFTYLVEKAGLDGIFNSNTEFDTYTLFVPSDTYLVKRFDVNSIKNMDMYTAREIVLYSSLNRQIYMPFLRSSPAMYINTRIPGSRILVENIKSDGVTTLDGCVKIIEGDIVATNGVIHVVNNLLWPKSFSISNTAY
jgi:hypothetical protein